MCVYELEARTKVDKIFDKLRKRDKKQMINIEKKLKEILDDPYRFKPLRKPLQSFRRVHVGKSFVFVFSVDEERKIVIIENYKHHDDVYKI